MTAEKTNAIVVRAPRLPWMEFILHFGTFGIYTCFWFVKRIRELNLIANHSFKPWLWFFVPFILLAQLFALPKFTSAIKKIEREHNIEPWKGYWNNIWLLCVFINTILTNIGDKLELPGWSYLVILLIWALLFSVFQTRINRYKNAISNLEFNGSQKNYSGFEWLSIVLLLPLVLGGLGYITIEPLLRKEIQILEKNSVYTDPAGYYQFPVLQEGWSIVETGSISSDEAELELQGPLSDMNFIVYFYGFNEDLNSLSYSRINYAREALNFASCNETRDFAKSQLSVISQTICSGSILAEKAVIISSIIETEKGFYELIGQLSSVKLSFKKHANTFKKMAEGFEPL